MEKRMKLGLHTYTLHLWGLGQNWGIQADPRPKEIDLFQLMDLAVEWGLDGLHITGCDLETKDDARLAAVKEAAQAHGLYLEYNFSRNEEFDPRLTDTLEKGIDITHKIGADLAKLSLDIRRPRPLYGSCFHPQVMRQLCGLCEGFDEPHRTCYEKAASFLNATFGGIDPVCQCGSSKVERYSEKGDAMKKNGPVPAGCEDHPAGFRLAAVLARHRERIIREWRDRLYTEVSDNYAARDPEELARTTARAYDAFHDVLAENDYTSINRFINEITKVRLESGFPLDDVQKAFELFRILMVPVLVAESPKSCLARHIEQVNTCLAYTIHRFSNHFQKMHETCLKEYADRLEREVAARTAQLKESEHKYKTLVEEISDGYLVLDGDTISFVNPAFCRMHGIDDPENILTTPFLNFVHPKDRPEVRRLVSQSQVTDPNASAAFEYRRLRMDGRALPTEMGSRLSRFEGREHVLCIVRDITRRVKLEKKNRQIERMAYIGQITASLSHEIRNPLSSIKMNLQILGQNHRFTGNDEKRLQITQTEIQRLETILQQLLDFAKPVSLVFGEVDVNEVVQFCVGLLDVKFRKIQAACRIDPAPSLPVVTADKARIEQVVINLLLNALDSIRPGGNVFVRTGVQTRNRKKFVTIQVSDDGAGIPPELIPHIFEPFYTTKIKGTGLGLANVKQMVQAHDGVVSVAAGKPSGTAFEVCLPCKGGLRG